MSVPSLKFIHVSVSVQCPVVASSSSGSLVFDSRLRFCLGYFSRFFSSFVLPCVRPSSESVRVIQSSVFGLNFSVFSLLQSSSVSVSVSVSSLRLRDSIHKFGFGSVLAQCKIRPRLCLGHSLSHPALLSSLCILLRTCPPRASEIMVWVSSAAPAKSMRTASTPDKSEIMVWVSSAAPAKSMPLCLCSRQVRNHGLGVLRGTCKEYADCLYSRQVRNHGLGVLRGTCKEYADCLYSRQVRNQNSLGVLCAPCKEYAAVPLLQTFQVRNQVSLIPLSTASCNCTMMQRVCLFRPVVRYLCNAFRCMNRSPVTPLFTVFSSCQIVKLSIKSHSHVSIVGICLANATRLCSQNLGLRLGLLLCSQYQSCQSRFQSCSQFRSQSRFICPPVFDPCVFLEFLHVV